MTSGGPAVLSRENTFDFLRLFAALAVLVEHSVNHLGITFLWHTPDDNYWFNGGVSLFFILSGMMVFTSAERCYASGRSWFDFYRNRALRIMPAIYIYFIATTILLLILGVISVSTLITPQYLAFAGTNLILAPVYSPAILDDFGIGVVNGSLWTIPVEVSFYVICPLLAILAAKIGWKGMLAVLLPVAAAGTIVFALVGGLGAESTIWKIYTVTFLPHLWYFAVGILIGRVWPMIRQSGWLALAGVVLYFVLAKWPLGGDPGWRVIFNAAAALPLAYAAVWFGYNGPRFFYRLTKRIGDLSFSTYIWHMIVINVLVTWGASQWDINGTLLTLIVAVVTVAISATSWWLVEKPALNRKRYSSTRATPKDRVTAP